MTWANKVTGANSRPTPPLEAGRQFGCASCAPPSLSAAVAQFWRYAMTSVVARSSTSNHQCTHNENQHQNQGHNRNSGHRIGSRQRELRTNHQHIADTGAVGRAACRRSATS